MYPDQPPIHWGGVLMWRGTSWAKPVRTGSSFMGLGTHAHRMVIYPISHPDPDTGLSLINWIAEVTHDDPDAYQNMGWYRQTSVDDFIHHFEDWKYDWLDVPALIRGSDIAYENPMIDRDPIPSWVDGPVALLGVWRRARSSSLFCKDWSIHNRIGSFDAFSEKISFFG